MRNKDGKKAKNQKKKDKKVFVSVSIILGIILLLIIFVIPFPYDAIEAHYEQESYTVSERVDAPDCDFNSNCKCEGAIQSGLRWLGVARCESCRCNVTKYRTVKREVRVTKSDILFNRWTGQTQYYFEVRR